MAYLIVAVACGSENDLQKIPVIKMMLVDPARHNKSPDEIRNELEYMAKRDFHEKHNIASAVVSSRMNSVSKEFLEELSVTAEPRAFVFKNFEESST